MSINDTNDQIYNTTLVQTTLVVIKKFKSPN